MPGDYCVVADNIKKLWDNYNPIVIIIEFVFYFKNFIFFLFNQLVVHCEMDCNLNKCLSLEQRATIDLNKFRLKDIEDQLPPPDPPGSVLTKDLYSNLNLIDIQEEINREYVENRGKLPVIISESAGRYLGEYLYRCSLKINPNRTILIRLPTYSDTGSFFDVGNCLTLIIDNCICQTIRIAQQN